MNIRARSVASILEVWRSRKGSQIGQYRLSHADVGVLLAEIERLQKYATHYPICRIINARIHGNWNSAPVECSCGLGGQWPPKQGEDS